MPIPKLDKRNVNVSTGPSRSSLGFLQSAFLLFVGVPIYCTLKKNARGLWQQKFCLWKATWTVLLPGKTAPAREDSKVKFTPALWSWRENRQ